MENVQNKRREMAVSETSFEELPLDIQTEILSRLPLKTLVKCICTSKKWASLIRTKEFIKLSLSRSTTKPRLFFVVYQYQRTTAYKVWTSRPISEVLFQSAYQEEEPLLSSGEQQVLLSPDPGHVASSPVRGLICLRLNTEFMIFNPGTNKRKHVAEIPLPNKSAPLMFFFGYDELTDVYKVLCIAEVTKEEQHVFTIGTNEASWRRIQCEHQHSPTPTAQGLCKEGVLYYRARSSTGRGLVMMFNLRSEEFSVIELHADMNIEDGWDVSDCMDDRGWELVNYNGAVALVNDYQFLDLFSYEWNWNKFFSIWVRNEVAGTWSMNCIEIPLFRKVVDEPKLYFFRGTTRTGKLVFSMKRYSCKNDGEIERT
ncbi:PREDICTED: putative F-box protein At1g70960 [Camelina sativa]|uniref:F-box protein At1g70960 n=1 Tax=Camelina sativa TaxID=90675 RepID=A0ABM1R3P1_CAMSA|nr:PREDICTED: putative F-box protein At1g70960 [Camelina sativa]XP_019093630.1 PREDICTED: putative F-box protein At1g70960 [Camelina sativa]XP_019093631.1 PREDICTED: putative F-box protein At1g70960 [Camelina sativa]